MKTVRTVLMATLTALLGLAVVCQGVPTACGDFDTSAQKAEARCKCCVASPVPSPAPSCCSTGPTGQRTPVGPASVPAPNRGINERLVLPAIIVGMLAIEPRARASENFVSTSLNSFRPSRAFPIFQRDCSYLI